MSIINRIIRRINEIQLDYQQQTNNELYKKDGLTDEVLNNQIAINRKRNALNITDKSELTKDNEGFVQ